MAKSNRDRVGGILELLNQGLQPFVERELKAVHGDKYLDAARTSFRDARGTGKSKDEPFHWDTHALLTIMWDQWNAVFKRTLGVAERSLVGELRDARNRWAHQTTFSTDDCYRVFDSVQRLLTAIAAEQATEVERQKQELLRVRFEEQARRETKKAGVASIEGQPAGGLKPWREVVTPHKDVASGRYQQAEFAADLAQVHRGEGADEYRHPTEFFRRTFITEGLRRLLAGALARLNGQGGDPVVELQTNFGGGKTHSMLALYHLFSGEPDTNLPGIEPVLEAAGVGSPKAAKRAVLVGTSISPGQTHTKPDGTVIHTLWGDLAWQLLGKQGYEMVADADRSGTNPGDALREVFKAAGPCLILIDEWVAYVRQLYGKDGLPGGSFDANLTFAQALTEAARAVPHTMVVASIPTSDIEVGGEYGKEALERLKNVFGRMESPWRPASAEESFEIVRRRLFHPITEPQSFVDRDTVVRAFGELYRTQSQEFPAACREADYERRMQQAYPIHPELFDRLYTDWSSLDKFQRTRGVLRLMAAVIHTLWERQDGSLLILPATVPIDEPPVQDELTRYLEDPWVPVIEKDVDGPHSLPLRLDRENPNLGRYSACRRVARTLYLGSAPTLHSANRGLEDKQVRLGCVQPGESVATFGDAIRRLTDQATHLYVDGRRYWYSTQQSVARLAQDRAAQLDDDTVFEEIKRRLRAEQGSRGDFARVHPCPQSSAEIPDEREARLIVLNPETATHATAIEQGEAIGVATSILEGRGNSPRLYRNSIVFLAADQKRLPELEQAVRQYLAWKSIDAERVQLNLDAFQSNQAHTKCEQANDTIKQRIPETYQCLLVPSQRNPNDPVTWTQLRLQGQDPLAVRASKKLKNEEMLIAPSAGQPVPFAGTRLRLELDRVPLWRGDHVPLKQLVEDFSQYIYLPRFRDPEVLVAAVRDGLALLTWKDDSFAYADSWDSTTQRYRGLRAGCPTTVTLDGESLLVKPEIAAKQIDADAQTSQTATGSGPVSQDSRQAGGAVVTDGAGSSVGEQRPRVLRRFHGSVVIDSTRLGRDAGKIAEEVVQHISGLMGAEVEVTLEIEARIPDGAPEHVVRTVTENCRTLRFRSQGFEET